MAPAAAAPASAAATTSPRAISSLQLARYDVKFVAGIFCKKVLP